MCQCQSDMLDACENYECEMQRRDYVSVFSVCIHAYMYYSCLYIMSISVCIYVACVGVCV